MKIYHMYHTYEARGAKIVESKATNKCQACQGKSPKGKRYLLVWLIDTCKHYVGGRPMGYNKKWKLCKGCRQEAFKPKTNDGRVLIAGDYEGKLLRALREMGISRYEIALKTAGGQACCTR